MNINLNVLIPIAQIGFGFFLLFMLIRLYFVTKNIKDWEKTEGTITKSDIKLNGAAYSPDVEFEYSVSGVSYKSVNMTMLLKQTYNKKNAQDWTLIYPIGKRVDVYYNPNNHRMAVLEKETSLSRYFVLIGLSIFLILSGVIFLLILLY